MKNDPRDTDLELEHSLKVNVAMSFEEIGQRLGITKGGAWMLYRSAILKLRRPYNRAALQQLQDLINFKHQRTA